MRVLSSLVKMMTWGELSVTHILMLSYEEMMLHKFCLELVEDFGINHNNMQFTKCIQRPKSYFLRLTKITLI